MARKKKLKKKKRFSDATKPLVKRGGSGGGEPTKNVEAAGPYRDQSSNPKIRSQATPEEHRKEPVKASHAPPTARTYPASSSSPTASEVFDTDIRESPAERRERRREERRAKAAASLLKPLPGGLDDPEDNPGIVLTKAKTEGRFPPEKMKGTHPEVYKEAEEEAHAFLAEKEDLEADPLAEFAIDALATKGLGTLAGKLGGAAASSVGAKLGSAGTSAAETAAERGGKALVEKVLTAPSKAKKGAKLARTKEGRRIIGKAEGQRIGNAGRRIKKKPIRSTLGVQAAAAPLGIETPGTERVGALVEGTGKAIYENPLGTAGKTATGLFGIVTGPLATGRAAVESITTGDSEPLETTLNEQIQGTLGLGEDLLSGNPDLVQETVEEKTGVAPFLPLASLSKTKAWKAGKGRIRKAANAGRRQIVKATGSERIRVVPNDVAADTYVIKPLESRAIRRRVSEGVTSSVNPDRLKADYHRQQILSELRKAPLPRSLRNRKGMEAGDLLQTFAEYGIRDMHDVRTVRARGPVGKEGGPGKVTLKAALDFAEAHPEILSDKHFKKALDAYVESTRQLPAAKAGKGRRAAIMAQGDMFGVLRPEERVPMAARPYTDAPTRAAAWAEVKARDREIAKLKQEARKAKSRDTAARLYGQVKAEVSINANLKRALGKYSRPNQVLKAGAKRRYYDDALLREYEADVAQKREAAGLTTPAWTHHREFREPAEIGPAYPTAAGRVQHMRSGSLAADDLVDRSLRALLSGSVVGPRVRAGGQKLAREFTEAEMLPVRVGDKTKHVVTSKEWSEALRQGQYSPRDYVLFPARQFKQAVLDPFRSQDEMAGIAGQALENSLRQDTSGNKYVVVRREAAKEFAAQIDPRRGAFAAFINNTSKGVSRWLLFSPAWVAIQSIAEAVPMVMAHPSLLSPAKVAKLERALIKNQKLNPDEARAFAAVAGEAPTSLHTPDELRPVLDSNPHGIFSDGARALTKSRMGRGFFSLIRLRPFAEFDNWRQGKYRELLMAAAMDKELNSWYSSLKGMLRIERRISNELRDLPRHEQLAAITKPKYRNDLDALKRHVENIAGNWQSFTRYERTFAPFIVFYPFVRYSLRWPLTFAKHHPVATEIATLLSAVNAEHLEKILGGPPDNPLAYAIPLWRDGSPDPEQVERLVAEGMDRERAELVSETHAVEVGPRAAPGTSAPTQSIVSGQPSQMLGMANPLLNAGFTGLTGINAYTGRQEKERGRQAADLLAATSPALRYFDVRAGDIANLVPGVDIEAEGESPSSKRFNEIDERKAARSLYEPWADLSGEQLLARENFGEALDTKYSDPIPNVWDNPDVYPALIELLKGKPAAYKKLLREHNAAEKAADRVEAQTEKFFDQAEDELTPREQKQFSNALEKLQGGIFIPSDEEEDKAKGGGSIGGTPLGSIGGGAGGQIGGQSAGHIGGKPLGDTSGGKKLKKVVPIKLPKIEGIDTPGEATEFAQWLSHYTKLDPQFVGAWVKSEGGGFANGGEAGKNNWLGVGYPGEQTAFSQSPYFNGDARTAAKATADWMKGKIGGEYDYAAADGIKEIIPKAAGKGPDVALQALAESGWGTNVEHLASNLSGVSVSGKTTGTAPKPAKKRKGEWAGTKGILLNAARGIEISSEKRTPEENAAVGGSPTSDHLTTNTNTFATDLPASGARLNEIGSTVAKRLGVKGWTPGNYDWYTSAKHPGYRFQILSEVDGHFDHVHVGAEWTGEDLPAGTMLGGTYSGESTGSGYSAPVSGGTGGVASATPATGKVKVRKKKGSSPRKRSKEVAEIEALLEQLSTPQPVDPYPEETLLQRAKKAAAR